MKKFKKVMAMGLATIAAVSSMSMSAIAAETTETESCTVYVKESDGSMRSFDLDVEVPCSFSENEKEDFVTSVAREEAGLSATTSTRAVSYYPIESIDNFTVYQNAGTVNTNAYIFDGEIFTRNYSGLSLYVKKKTGNYSSVNVRLDWEPTYPEGSSGTAFFMEESLDFSSNDTTILFVNGRNADGGNKVVLDTLHSYSLALSGQAGSGTASVSVKGYIN